MLLEAKKDLSIRVKIGWSNLVGNEIRFEDVFVALRSSAPLFFSGELNVTRMIDLKLLRSSLKSDTCSGEKLRRRRARI